MTIHEFELFTAIAAIIALWGQLSWLLAWPLRLLTVERELDDTAARLVTGYLLATARRVKFSGGFFRLENHYVRPLDGPAAVFCEDVHQAGQMFWHRGPVWYRYAHVSDGPHVRFLYYIRWSRNWDAFLIAAAEWAHQCMHERGGMRYRIVHHGVLPSSDGSNPRPSAPTSKTSDFEIANAPQGLRVIGWDRSDIGPPPPLSLTSLSLNDDQRSLSADVDRFMRSRRWCETSTIPWRRGWLLKGAPGTGKTSFVRAVAVEHDLPVHAFDLGSMDNASLRFAWETLLSDTPAIALIEDIDGVYGVVHDDGTVDTRALVADGPTFDCLLQCIGGISVCNGVLLFVTSNRPERVDSALRRGGRIDSEVEFTGMDNAGRFKMALRILGDESAAELAASDAQLAALSPANFQEQLFRRALAERFADPA